MPKDRVPGKVAAVFLLAAVAGGASLEPPTFSATARSVRVPVTVVDKRGEPVLGLRGEDFKLSEDGRRQAVTFFSGERRPLRIALALDVSSSMRDKMDEVSDALRYFIDLLEPADQIMVITFSGTLHVDQDFTSDRRASSRSSVNVALLAVSTPSVTSTTALLSAGPGATRRMASTAAS